MIYILCGWSVVRPIASLTDMDSPTGDYHGHLENMKQLIVKKIWCFELRKELYEDLSLSTASHSLDHL